MQVLLDLFHACQHMPLFTQAILGSTLGALTSNFLIQRAMR